jgi:hypothetical protein
MDDKLQSREIMLMGTGRNPSEPELQKLPYMGELLPHQIEVIKWLEQERNAITGIDFGRIESRAVLMQLPYHDDHILTDIDMAEIEARVMELKARGSELIIIDEASYLPDPEERFRIYKDPDGRAEQRAYFESGPPVLSGPYEITLYNGVSGPAEHTTNPKPLTKRQRRRQRGKGV